MAVAQQKTQPPRSEIVLVVFADGVGDEGYTGAVLLAMPPCAVRTYTLSKSLIDFGVGERLGLAVVPAKTGKRGQVTGEVLLKVDAEAVFARDVPGMIGDVGRGSLLFRLKNLGAIDAHVGIVGEGEQANYARFFRDEAVT